MREDNENKVSEIVSKHNVQTVVCLFFLCVLIGACRMGMDSEWVSIVVGEGVRPGMEKTVVFPKWQRRKEMVDTQR